MKLSYILPIYNEAHSIQELYERILKSIGEISYELIFINDGSKDESLLVLQQLAKKDSNVMILDFSRNFWHQIAISAGMDFATGDAIIIMDTDLQDRPEVVPEMIKKWNEWYEVVYAKRKTRKDTFFKKITAKLFYRTLKRLSTIDIPLDTWDFRLMDKKVVNEIKRLREHSRFMRWLVSWVGFRQTYIEFDRDERRFWETGYPLTKMIWFALDGITSFSYKPLKIATILWLCVSILTILYSVYAVGLKLYYPDTVVQWWTTVIVAVMMIGWLQLMILWLIGEYIGRIYTETQNRPLYIINKIYNEHP